MNKYQEAIIWLENTFNQYLGDWRLSSVHYGLYRDFEELVDKATPVMVDEFMDLDGVARYQCPVCKNDEKLWQTNPVNYCLNCGKALKWSEKDE